MVSIKFSFHSAVLKQKLVNDVPWAVSGLFLYGQLAKNDIYIFKVVKRVHATKTIYDTQSLEYLIIGLSCKMLSLL